jgi:hypothetical protein
MRPTLILPITVVLLAAISSLAIERRRHKAQSPNLRSSSPKRPSFEAP